MYLWGLLALHRPPSSHVPEWLANCVAILPGSSSLTCWYRTDSECHWVPASMACDQDSPWYSVLALLLIVQRLELYVVAKFVVSALQLHSSSVRREWVVNPGVLQKARQEGDERIQNCSYKSVSLLLSQRSTGMQAGCLNPSYQLVTVRLEPLSVTVTLVCAASAFWLLCTAVHEKSIWKVLPEEPFCGL